MNKFTDLVERNLLLANELSEHLLYKQKEADQLEMSKRRADLNHRQRLQDMLCKCLSQSGDVDGGGQGVGLNTSERIHYLNECLNGGGGAGGVLNNNKATTTKTPIQAASTTNNGNFIHSFLFNTMRT